MNHSQKIKLLPKKAVCCQDSFKRKFLKPQRVGFRGLCGFFTVVYYLGMHPTINCELYLVMVVGACCVEHIFRLNFGHVQSYLNFEFYQSNIESNLN